MVFQWFPIVANHWSNDGMVTIHRRGLVRIARYFVIPAFVRQKLCDVYNEGSKAMTRQQKEISLEAW